MVKANKNHWYDGSFYDKIIAPNQDRAYTIVKDLINENSTLLDAGCGTGRLAFTFADKLKSYTGIDLSIRNIEVANKKLKKSGLKNIYFIHNDLLKFLDERNSHFDYAVMSYVIHEIDITLRLDILKALAEAAKEVILIEYLAPRPKNFWAVLNEAVEFVAGRDHYRNFKTFIANNGITGLAHSAGLQITHEVKNNPSTSHIAVLSK